MKELTIKQVASLGGKARWKGKTPEEITKHMRNMGQANSGKKKKRKKLTKA